MSDNNLGSHVMVSTHMYRNTGINCFWIINNSQQVLNRVRKSICTVAVSTFIFCLYTRHYITPYLRILIEEAFRIRGENNLNIDRLDSVYWTQSCCAKWNMSKELLIKIMSLLGW